MSVTFAKLTDRVVAELINRYSIHEIPELNNVQIMGILRVATDQIIEALSEGEDVALDGFGRFYPDIKPPKKVHSGITGKKYNIGPRVIIKFNAFNKMSKEVSKLIRWVTPISIGE